MVTRIDDAGAASALTAERALVAALGGGCQTPIGALATPDGEALDLVAVVVSLDGARSVRSHVRGNARDAAALGAEAAARLLRDGAGEILAEAQRTPPMAGGA
jgi:hydroxymethylbilane synthase